MQLQRTAYHAWLFKSNKGNTEAISAQLYSDITQDNNPQAWKILEATKDEAITNETFTKAANLIKQLYQ